MDPSSPAPGAPDGNATPNSDQGGITFAFFILWRVVATWLCRKYQVDHLSRGTQTNRLRLDTKDGRKED